MDIATTMQNADLARFARRWDEALALYANAAERLEGWALTFATQQMTEIKAQIAFEAAKAAYDDLCNDPARDDSDSDGMEARLALEVVRLSRGCSCDNSAAIAFALHSVERHMPVPAEA